MPDTFSNISLTILRRLSAGAHHRLRKHLLHVIGGGLVWVVMYNFRASAVGLIVWQPHQANLCLLLTTDDRSPWTQPPGQVFVELYMPWLRINKLAASFFILISLALVNSANAQKLEPSAIEITAQAGYDGFYKAEYWVPVYVTVSNGGPPVDGYLQIIVGDAFNGDEVTYSAPISLPTQSSKRLPLFIHLSDLTGSVTVALVDERDRELKRVESNNLDWLAVDELLYGVVSSEPGDLGYLENIHGSHSDAAVAYLDLADLPESTSGWNTLDILILHDIDTGSMSQAQLEALKGWLSTGGHLVVAGGVKWQETVASLGELLPVTIFGTQSFEDLPGFQAQAKKPFRDPGPYLVTSSSLQNGTLLLHENGLPLLAKRDIGRGAVYFLALDPSQAPLADWDGNQLVWDKVVSSIPHPPIWAIGANNGYAASNAVSSLPALSLPSAGLLALFLIVYVLIVGPLNYLVLKRLHHRELAWITIPGVVIIFSGLAFIAGFRLKGNDAVINQMSIAFGHIDGGQLRVQTLLGLYSPRRATYDLLLPGETMVRPFEAAYGGLTGGGNIDSVERANDVVVTGLRVDVGGVQSLVVDSYQPAPLVTGEAILRTTDKDLILDIMVQNDGSKKLENATVLIGSTAIPLGDLDPGTMKSLSKEITSAQYGRTIPGMSPAVMPTGPMNSPLTANFATILGTADYYNDREVYPRWQLLEAMASEFSPLGGTTSSEKATLIVWSGEKQLDLKLLGSDFENLGTTVYFLELPITQSLVNAEEITIPKALLNWRLLGQSGVYNPSISDLYLPPGWVEFEFQPWPEFQTMSVSELKVVLHQREGNRPISTLRTQLWDWDQELWVVLEDLEWGTTALESPSSFIGAGNAVRLRLQNNDPEGIDILEVYPQIAGTLD